MILLCQIAGKVGRNSVVGIAARYGLDGPGIEFRFGEIFCNSPGRSWGTTSFLHKGYRVIRGGKAAIAWR